MGVFMQGVTFSTPKEISDAWKSNMALTDGLLEAVASASGSSSETEGVLKALDETAKKMEQIYAAAIKSAEYEDNCCGFSYRSFLGLMGKGIDAGIHRHGDEESKARPEFFPAHLRHDHELRHIFLYGIQKRRRPLPLLR